MLTRISRLQRLAVGWEGNRKAAGGPERSTGAPEGEPPVRSQALPERHA